MFASNEMLLSKNSVDELDDPFMNTIKSMIAEIRSVFEDSLQNESNKRKVAQPVEILGTMKSVPVSSQPTNESRNEVVSQITAKTEVAGTLAPVEEEQEYEIRTTVSMQNHIDFTEGKITQEELESRYVTERIPVAKPTPIPKFTISKKSKANIFKATNFSDINKLNISTVQEVSQDKIEASEESKPVKVEKGIEDLDPETVRRIQRHNGAVESMEYLKKRDSERPPSETRVYANKTYDRIAKDFILSQEQLNNVQKELNDIVVNPNLDGLENEKTFMDYVYDRVKLSGATRRPN